MTMITGKDLIEMGFVPGPWFGTVLEQANARGMSLQEAAGLARECLAERARAEAARQAREKPLHAAPMPYRFNIEAGCPEEAENVAAVRQTFDILMRTPVIEQGVVLPDACPAGPEGTIPVGGVVAARNAILPGCHSADICCSMTATLVDGIDPAALLDAVHSITHFGPGGLPRHKEYALPEDLRDAFSANTFLRDAKLQGQARSHFGTCGDGFSYA